MVGKNKTQTMYSGSSIPVDAANKATELRLFSVTPPHMRAFHLAWLSLFSNFFSAFAIPSLITIIRDDLNLTATDIANAGIASFAGAIFSRLVMGIVCDLVGPRYSSGVLSILTAPIVFAVSFASSGRDVIILRFLIGFSLANFVASQFWMSTMFSSNVVGLANGFVAGWANVGSGVTQLVMPLVYTFILATGMDSSMSWRLAFIVPSIFQLLTGFMVLVYGQDLPEGDYGKVHKLRKRPVDGFLKIFLHGLLNYRAWILGLTYGFCFGVELVIDNIIAQYFYDRFDLDVTVAGAIAASFSLANIVSRPFGGVVSDFMGGKFGIKGRLWSLWVVQSVAGLLCVLLGRLNSLYTSMVVMWCFSLFVQAASGLTFGVVPFVSKRSLGVVSGMTGSGGTLGAVVTQLFLFSGSSSFSTQTGISLMGVMMLVCTLPLTLMYFQHQGGMFCGPGDHAEDYFELD